MSLLARLRAWLGVGRSAAPSAPAPSASGAAPAEEVPPVAALTGLAVGLTPRDMERLRGVHPDLVRVVIRARVSTPFFVAEGVRTAERQAALYRAGASRTMNSRHLTGHAVDLYPITDRPIPSLVLDDYLPIIQAMQAAARREGVALVCGYDWGWDAPHHELDRRRYP